MNSQEEFLQKLEAFCEAEGYFIICTDEDASMSLIPVEERFHEEHYRLYDDGPDFDLVVE